MRTCTKCKAAKDEAFFHFRKSRDTFHSWCKACVVVASYESTKKLKLKAIDYKGGKCVDCGYNKYYGALEFHHLDPNQKDFGINEQSRQKSTWEHIKPELDKCVLLCSNCHKERHAINAQ